MSGRVVRRSQAKRDLIKHFVYLAEKADLETARRFLRAADAACDLLAGMPELGPRREFKAARLRNTRMWPIKEFREFLIFYQPISGGIRLVRVIHAKQDYWRVIESLPSD